MSAKTPLPPRSTGMALRAREKDSQKHPGKPDLPRQKRSSSVVQAEKVEKARVQTEKKEMRGENIQETANVEAQMEKEMEEKLVNAHHPQPSTQKKVPRPRSKVPQVSKGATSECPDGVVQDEAPRDSGEEYFPSGKDTVESEDGDESDILDESDPGNEPTTKERATRKKKKPNQGSLRAAVQAAQGKSVQGGELKRKAGSSVDTEELSRFHSQKNTRRRTRASTMTGPREHSVWERTTLTLLINLDLIPRALLCRSQTQVVRLHPCSTQMTTRGSEESPTTPVRYPSAWTW
ncbi:hypothetical protein EDB84DRAFT_1150659 [Lactarius hengduanensis]|nr:hypothetical protein EDB84DRAFT_1150659 [Lactarius hengduanensis]